jgi:N,N'-diacetyllegionaminate synthase
MVRRSKKNSNFTIHYTLYPKRCFIIAEAGVNHNGSLATAKKLIDRAARVGCDAVKFQTFKAERLVTKTAPKARYQIENTGKSESQFAMLKRLELSEEDHKVLFAHCRKKGIVFMSTPFDEESVDLLARLGMGIFKISSGEMTNKPLVQRVAAHKRSIILSTGMSYLDEVAKAIDWIYGIWGEARARPALTLLHCVANYPARVEDTNLKAMAVLACAFGLPVGLSDHTMGIEIPIAAAALGAAVIEKHFTLDKTMEGPDHRASLEPDEMKAMVAAIRNVEKAMGDGAKRPARDEYDTRRVVRKSLVAARDIRAGDLVLREDIAVKRPGTGLAPEMIDEIVNRRAAVDIKKDGRLTMTYFDFVNEHKAGDQ